MEEEKAVNSECKILVIEVDRIFMPERTNRRISLCQWRDERRVTLTVLRIDVRGPQL